MPKLFVSDIDGTLLPKGETALSESVVGMLKKLISAGVVTALASGRSYDSVEDVFPDGKIPDGLYIISNDGALCTHDGKALYHKPFSSESLTKLFEAAKCCGAGFFCREKDSLVYGNSDIFLDCGAFAEARGKRVTDIARHESIYKIGTVDENAKGSGMVHLPGDVRCAYDDGYLREYVSKYANKATALEDLQARTFAHREDTFVCGDGENDVCMTSKAKYCASVGACFEQMQRACSLHFSNGEDALKYYIANFLG